jgi:hypothetical protein|nr:MAG TPA: tail protein [Caudoviricetes sp.]
MTPDIRLNGASVAGMGWLRETISFPVPQSQSNTIVVPGRNSPIRFTEALGRISYQPRSFSLTFSMLGTRAKYDQMVSEIANRYVGQLVQVSTSEEPELYAIGTLEISSEYDPLLGKGKLVISSEDADSYRYHTEITEVSQQIQGIRTITLMNDYMPVIPKIIITNGASLAWAIGEESFQKTLSPGTWEIPELELVQGTNNIRVQTNGTITFQYKEGRL